MANVSRSLNFSSRQIVVTKTWVYEIFGVLHAELKNIDNQLTLQQKQHRNMRARSSSCLHFENVNMCAKFLHLKIQLDETLQ